MRWKAFERQVAGFFQGLRRSRIRYDESIGDIIHPFYSIECKYGKQVPKYLAVKQPTMLLVDKKRYVVVPSGFLEVRDKWMSCSVIAWSTKRLKRVMFLEKVMKQAERYNPKLISLVCVKPRRRRGFIVIWEAKRRG